MELSVWLIKRGILGGLSKDSQEYCGNMHRKIFYVIYRLQTIENYYQLWLHVLLCVRSFIAIVYVFVYHTVHVYLHSFSAWCIHTFILVNIRSAHCPCTYSLAVYIYNTWEDIIIYAFCLFVYIERIFLSKKSRQKRLPRINCTKLCQVWKGGICSLKVKKVSVNKGVLMSSQTSNSLIQVVDLYLSLCCLF